MGKLGPDLVVINFFVGFVVQFCDLGWEISDLLYPGVPKYVHEQCSGWEPTIKSPNISLQGKPHNCLGSF